jgi:hypothetical protein
LPLIFTENDNGALEYEVPLDMYIDILPFLTLAYEQYGETHTVPCPPLARFTVRESMLSNIPDMVLIVIVP